MKSKAGSFAKKHLGQEHDQSMADLPQDLAEEVLSRLPMTSLASVRSTCKAWNALSKDSSFTTKHFGRQAKLASAAKDDFMLVLMMDYEIYLVSVNLDDNADDVSWMRHEGTLVSQNCTDQIDVCEVFHCYGLLLCISQDNARLVVWNPYWGQSMWLEPARSFERLECYIYDLGYDKSSNSHKILSFADYTILHHTDSGFTDHDYQILDHTDYDFLTDHYQFLDHSDYDAPPAAVTFAEYSIYDFNTHSWRVLDVTLDLILDDDCRVSIGGNTYWFARSKASGREEDCCLLCFDYTRETFGARLPLPPLEWHDANTIALSSVGEEQLAILFQRWWDSSIKIWVTTKIEPDAVSWSSKVFLAVHVSITSFRFPFSRASFFVDEEKRVAVVFGKDDVEGLKDPSRNVAYIIGVDGSLEIIVPLGDSPHKYCFPRVCSYVPTLVQLN